MITRVAFKVGGKVYVGEAGKRHDSVIHAAVQDGCSKPARGTQGFITDDGTFLDRHDAAKHAFACGQLPNDKVAPDGILSEDLW